MADAHQTLRPSPVTVALAGLVALAVSMGVGRFAFTPILPMMQTEGLLTVAEGGWLASANYLGFLIAAMAVIWMRADLGRAILGGLVVIGVVTVAMAIDQPFWSWLVLRAIAGLANAWVQIFTFAWCLGRLAGTGRPILNGAIFAGVGTGIAVAGLVCLVLMQIGASSGQAWIWMGALSFLATAAVWRIFRAAAIQEPVAAESTERPSAQWTADWWRLVLCFGASGFGYIIPATFLPVMAREIVADPLVFGWAWPIFGIATAAAPLATAELARRLGNRRLWALGHLVMATGVALPVVWQSIEGIMVAALLIGGSFMVNAMPSMQEGRAIGGTALMAAMTASFALGQIVGPIVAAYLMTGDGDFDRALIAAAVLLVASAAALAYSSLGTSGRSKSTAPLR